MWDPDPGCDLLIIAMVLQFLYIVDRQKIRCFNFIDSAGVD